MFIPYGTGLYLCALRAFTSLRSGYENATHGSGRGFLRTWTWKMPGLLHPKTTVCYWSGRDLKMATNIYLAFCSAQGSPTRPLSTTARSQPEIFSGHSDSPHFFTNNGTVLAAGNSRQVAGLNRRLTALVTGARQIDVIETEKWSWHISYMYIIVYIYKQISIPYLIPAYLIQNDFFHESGSEVATTI